MAASERGIARGKEKLRGRTGAKEEEWSVQRVRGSRRLNAREREIGEEEREIKREGGGERGRAVSLESERKQEIERERERERI